MKQTNLTPDDAVNGQLWRLNSSNRWITGKLIKRFKHRKLILRRNCLRQRVTEGKIQGGIEVTGRQGRRRSKLLDDLKKKREYSHLKEEALDHTMWRAGFGRGFGPVLRQTTK